jgi:hypothetical protein
LITVLGQVFRHRSGVQLYLLEAPLYIGGMGEGESMKEEVMIVKRQKNINEWWSIRCMNRRGKRE